MTKRLLLLCSLAALLLPATAQDHLYVCHGAESQAVELRNADELQFLSDSLRIGLNECYALAAIDSRAFARPTLRVSPIGWIGDADDEDLFFYYTPQKRITIFDDCPFWFRVKNDTCFSAMRVWAINVAPELVQQMIRLMETGIMVQTPATMDRSTKYRYVKRTLTRRRPSRSTNASFFSLSKTRGRFNADYYSGDSLLMFEDIYNDLLVGKPMDDVKRIVYVWTHPGADADVLPATVQFGTFDQGHYSIKVNWFDGPTVVAGPELTIDLQYSADSTRVTGSVLKLIYSNSQLAKNDYSDMADLKAEEGVTVSCDDNVITIAETCDISAKEAMDNLIWIDLDLMFPEVYIDDAPDTPDE